MEVLKSHVSEIVELILVIFEVNQTYKINIQSYDYSMFTAVVVGLEKHLYTVGEGARDDQVETLQCQDIRTLVLLPSTSPWRHEMAVQIWAVLLMQLASSTKVNFSLLSG